MVRFSLLAIGVGSMTGCNYAPTHADYAQLWGALGAGVFDTLKAPESVEYYKVASTLPGKGQQNYQPASKIQSLSDEEIVKLKALLLNDNHYLFGVLKKCVFVPEVVFHFKKGTKELYLLVSLTCKQVTYDLGGQQIRLDIDPDADAFAEFINHLSY